MAFVLKKEIKTLSSCYIVSEKLFHFSYLAYILVIVCSAFLTTNNLCLSPGC